MNLLDAVCRATGHKKLNEPYFRSGHGGWEPNRNRVGAEYRIESPFAHDTSILQAGIDFHLIRCALSLSFRVYHLEIFIQEESFPARNQ